MEIRSRQKKKTEAEQAELLPANSPVLQDDQRKGNYSTSISIQCNSMLYNTIQGMIISSHTAQDFTYNSVTDFLRAALRAYSEGMQLTELQQQGEKMQTTVRVEKELKEFYHALPSRLRVRLLERAIRTFLKKHH